MLQHVHQQLVLNALKENVALAHASSRVQILHAEGPVDSVILKSGAPASQQTAQQMFTFKMGHLVKMAKLTAFQATARLTMHSVKHTSEQVSTRSECTCTNSDCTQHIASIDNRDKNQQSELRKHFCVYVYMVEHVHQCVYAHVPIHSYSLFTSYHVFRQRY